MNNVVELLSLRAPTVGDLPPPNTQRWVARRKAAVVAAVRNGTITMEEALRRYQLTEEEFFSWQRAFEPMALRVCAPRASSNTWLASAARPQIAALRSSWFRASSVDSAYRLAEATDQPNLVLASTFFAKNSSSTLIAGNGWCTCITEQPARRHRRPARDQSPVYC